MFLNTRSLALALALPTFVGAALAAQVPSRPDEVLVKVKPGFSPTLVAGAVGGNSKDLGGGWYLVKFPRALALSRAKVRLRANRAVSTLQENFVFSARRTVNDPDFSRQYGPQLINSPQAWDLSFGSPTVSVAIIDNNIDISHEDLAPRIFRPYDFVQQDSNPTTEDAGSHGTHVSGCAAAISNNGKGIASPGANVNIMAIRIDYSVAQSVLALRYAADNGARVANMSYGGSFPLGTRLPALQEALDYGRSKGMLSVGACGNFNENLDTVFDYPTSMENVIGVGASDRDDRKAGFSNFNGGTDVYAPGVGILSTLPGNRYVEFDGTSMASPIVAGAAALMFAYNPRLTPARVEQALFLTAKPIGPGAKYGRIDAYRAMQLVRPDELIASGPTDAYIATPAGPRGQQALVASVDRVTLDGTSVNQSIGAVVVAMAEVDLAKGGYNPVGTATIKLTAAATSSNITQQIYMRDWTSTSATPKFDLVRQMPLLTGTQSADLGIPAARFLSEGKVQIMVRALRPRGRGNQAAFRYSIDALSVDGRYTPISIN